MTDIQHLINMNVEIEGLLRILERRDSEHARGMLTEKIKAYNALLETYLASPTAETATEVEDAGESVLAEANAEEVKEQEAVDSEVAPEEDLAEAAIARETESVKPTPVFEEEKTLNSTVAVHSDNLAKAFTLNDRFRFKRELFGGNDEDFTDTLQLLSEMDNYSEAEDYLLNDMMWKKDDPAVADFLAVLSRNMNNGKR